MSGSGSNRYRGIRERSWGKFVSEIRQPHRRPGSRSNRIWLGSFRSAEEAAHAYDAALLCCRGRNGNLNFPNYPYNIPPGTVGQYSVREIQAAAAAAAAQYAGRPFSYGNFNSPPGASSDDEGVDDITHDEGDNADDYSGPSNYNPDDPYNLRINDINTANNDDDDDEDDDDEDDSDDDDDPPLWGN